MELGASSERREILRWSLVTSVSLRVSSRGSKARESHRPPQRQRTKKGNQRGRQREEKDHKQQKKSRGGMEEEEEPDSRDRTEMFSQVLRDSCPT